MNYEEKYNQTIESIKRIYNQADSYGKELMEKEFPQLRESEDERIKKCIGMCLTDVTEQRFEEFNTTLKDCLAWLEKQGEQKPADKVEPKFKVEKGKWYVCTHDLLDKYANKAFCKGDTYLSTQDGSLVPCNRNVPYKITCPDTYFRDWTIQDAKNGDVLEFGDHGRLVVGIVSYVNKTTGKVDVNCLLENNNLKVGNYYNLDTIKPHPTTKEQCELLFQKMHEAGYEWDAEKKELKKIEQNPSWSEEDEKLYSSALWHIKNSCGNGGKDSGEFEVYNWLKSIKSRIMPQQEWSDKDEIFLFNITKDLEKGELTEFEQEYEKLYTEGYADGQAGSKPLSDKVLKECAAELLNLARNEILKDLPKWEKTVQDYYHQGNIPCTNPTISGNEEYLIVGSYKIKISDLKTLPKEE